MATRQEIQLGHDLMWFVDHYNRSLWQLSMLLQRKDYIGNPLVIYADGQVAPINPTPVTLTVDVIKALVNRSPIMLGKPAGIKKVFDNAGFSTTITNGTAIYAVQKTTLVGDNTQQVTARTVAVNALPAANNLAKLANIGVQLEGLTGFVYNPTDHYIPPIVAYANACHDLLDALSYEFSGINSHNGVTGITLDQMRFLASDRLKCFSLSEEKARGYISGSVDPRFDLNLTGILNDLDALSLVASYIEAQWPLCTNEADFANLAAYISAHVVKLPLVRRHWSIV